MKKASIGVGSASEDADSTPSFVVGRWAFAIRNF